MEFKIISDVRTFMRNLTQKVLFRGQADFNWFLIPSIARNGNSKIDEEKELKRIEKAYKYSLDSSRKVGLNVCDRLSLVQHYGLFKTRFLDWTENVLVALYFACNKKGDKDGAVYVFEAPNKSSPLWYRDGIDKGYVFDGFKIYSVHPFLDEIPCKIKGKADKVLGKRRPELQGSIMTICPETQNGNFWELEALIGKDKIQKIKIPSDKKVYFRKILDEDYGINKDTILNGKSILDLKTERGSAKAKSEFIANYILKARTKMC